jgi:phosphoglycolate phosphatase
VAASALAQGCGNLTSGTVLFDLDGALTDSAPGIAGSINAALQALGHAVVPKLDWAIGPPIDDVMARLMRQYGDNRVAEGVALYRQFYGASGLFDNALYPGIPDMLDNLVGAGFALCLATSKRRAFAERILAHFGLAGRFRGIYGSEEGGLLDHKPALIAHILAREAVLPADAVMIGDRHYDVAGAHANGVRAIGVTWGYGGIAELRAAGADAFAFEAGSVPPQVMAILE